MNIFHDVPPDFEYYPRFIISPLSGMLEVSDINAIIRAAIEEQQ